MVVNMSNVYLANNIYLANAFSLSMLPPKKEFELHIREIDINEVKEWLKLKFTSVIGHEATASVLSQLLGIQIPVNRIQIKLEHGDILIVFQLMTRLPEGKILTREELEQLIQQGLVKFYYVSVYDVEEYEE